MSEQEQERVTFEDNETVAVYCRVSTDSDDQINSLENQKTYFHNFAKEKGLRLFKIYYDEGLTGTSWKNRDGFNDMLKAAGLDVVKEIDRHTLKTRASYTISKKRAPKFSKILVKSTSRFARNVLSIELIKLLRRAGVYIYFLEQNLLTTVKNDFILTLFMNFDENESRDKSIKVKFGYKEGARKGMVYGGWNIFGYDYDAKTNTLKKNKDAEVVKLIFDMYTKELLGIRVICNRLTAAGYKTKKGRSEWGKTTVRNILTNEKYAGKNPIQKYDAGMILEDKHYPKRREGYKVEDTDKIETIVSWEQFQEAQRIRENKTEKYNGQTKGRKNVYGRYTKLIKCSNCGSFYIRNTDYRSKKKRTEDKYYFYNCAGKKKRGVKFCNSPNILEEDLDKVIKSLAYGRLKEEVELRLYNLRSWLLYCADRLTEETDKEKDKEAEAFASNVDIETEKLQTMYNKLLTMDDPHGIIAGMIKEQEQKLTEVKAAYEAAKGYNIDIVEQVRTLINEYNEASDTAEGLKKRYSEEEVLSMIQYIYIDDAEYFDFGHINPTYKILSHLEDVLRPYAEKYDINIENWQHAHTVTKEEAKKIDDDYMRKLVAFLEHFGGV